MDKQSEKVYLPLKVKIFGSLFLFIQLTLAVNNYGPHQIPILKLIFHEPWIPQEIITLQQIRETNETGFIFEDVTDKAGLNSFYRAKVNETNPSYLEVMSGGVAVGDINKNGLDDIFLISIRSFKDHPENEASKSTLFKNNGDGTFLDITEESGLGNISGYPQGAIFFDFNNNGRQDLYVASYGGGQLFKNDGGYFTDVTNESGLNLDGLCGNAVCYSSAVSAVDYNRNGFLDIYIVNNVIWDIDNPSHYGERQLFPAFFEAQSSFLFRNNGDGTFTNVTNEAGVSNRGGKGLSAIWFDFNNDGWPDLYIANDLTRNKLFINRGDGTFTDIAASARVNEVKSSMGVASADFNQNGIIDFIITNLEGSYLSLFRNIGDFRFDYATHYAGLNPSRRSSGWGVEFADFNLNGFQDLVMAAGPVWDLDPLDAENLFFENNGDGTFSEITLSAGTFENNSTSRGLAVLDILNDGKPDLIINNIDGGYPQLLMNRTNNQNQWLKMTLEGVESNRDAVGARVILNRSDGITLTQEVQAGGSYQSMSTKSLFFGLGSAELLEITIKWPSGQVQSLTNVPVNTSIHIIEMQEWFTAKSKLVN